MVQAEYALAIILEANILKMADRGEPVKVIYPKDGVIITPSSIAIFANSQNPEAAKALTDWWLSKEGQEMVVKGWMHSVRDDMPPPKGAPSLNLLTANALKIDWEQLAKENEQYKERFRSIVLESK